MARQVKTLRPEAPLLYDPQTVGRLLMVSSRTVYRMIHCGELDAVRAGMGDKSWRITRESIEAWLAARKAERRAEIESERTNAAA